MDGIGRHSLPYMCSPRDVSASGKLCTVSGLTMGRRLLAAGQPAHLAVHEMAELLDVDHAVPVQAGAAAQAVDERLGEGAVLPALRLLRRPSARLRLTENAPAGALAATADRLPAGKEPQA